MIKVGISANKYRKNFEDVAVILPAFNEESVVGETIRSFQTALPGCTIVVCNNNSSDATRSVALQAGAAVIDELRAGKGHAVRRLLSTVDANIYVMADADSTYDAESARSMIDLLEQEHLDMVTGIRQHVQHEAYRSGHLLGNKAFNHLFKSLFSASSSDIFSGYRVFTKRFSYAMPIQSSGFEIETEMTALASILKLPTGEFPVKYYARPEGSHSKLNTYQDGFRILRNYFRLLRHFYPKKFYGYLAVTLGMISLALGTPIVTTFVETGLVPRMPTAILASSLGVISVIAFMTGLILESVAKNRIEQRLLTYYLVGRQGQ